MTQPPVSSNVIPFPSQPSSQRASAASSEPLERLPPLERVERQLLSILAICRVPLPRGGLEAGLRAYPAELRVTGKQTERALGELGQRPDVVSEDGRCWMENVDALPWIERLRLQPDWPQHLEAARAAAGNWRHSSGEGAVLRERASAWISYLTADVHAMREALLELQVRDPKQVPLVVGELVQHAERSLGQGDIRRVDPLLVPILTGLLQAVFSGAPRSRSVRALASMLDRLVPMGAAAKGKGARELRQVLNDIHVEYAIARGDWAECQRRCEAPDGVRPAYADVPDWLCGSLDLDGFVERYREGRERRRATHPPEAQAAPKESDKGRSRQASPWEGLGSAFACLALLSKQTPDADAEAYRMSGDHAHGKSWAARRAGFEARRLSSVRLGWRDGLEPFRAFEGLTAVDQLLEQILLHWSPAVSPHAEPYQELLQVSEQKLREYVEAEHREHPWLARQWLALLEQRSPKAAADVREALGEALPRAPAGELRLAQLVTPKPEWEEVFEQLERAVAETQSSPTPSTREKRLAWSVEVHGEYWHLQPKLQTRKGRGFTKGRNVAVRRLFEGDYPCELCAQDQAVLARIRRHQEPTYYGHYLETTYDIDPGAIAHLVGHPAVYEADSMVPLNVTAGQPRVALEPTRGGYHLVRVPQSADSVSVVQSGSELVVYSLSPEQQRLFQVLEQPMVFPAQALERARQALSAVSSHVLCVDGEQALGDVVEEPADSRVIVQLRPGRGRLDVALIVRPLGEHAASFPPSSGPERVVGQRGAERILAVRDFSAEQRHVDALLEGCPVLAGVSEHADAGAAQFSLQELDEMLELTSSLTQLGASVEWPEGQAYRILPAAKGKVRVSAASAADWLGVDVEVPLEDDTRLDYQLLLAAVRAGRRFVALDNGAFAELQQGLVRKLERLSAFQIDEAEPTRLHPLAALTLEAEEGWSVEGDRGWTQRTEELGSLLGRAVRQPRSLKAELRDYQRAGFEWAVRLSRIGAGACLADDMGLGKTVQTLALLLARASEGPALVIAPASVLGNWQREAQRFAPSLRVQQLADIPIDAERGARSLPRLAKKDVFLATYDLATREIETLRAHSWATLVLDEAQALKNPDAQRTRAIATLPAGFKLALSGTPLENHLGELWSLFAIINPGLLGTRRAFSERFQTPIERGSDATRTRQLQHLIAPFILRRTKDQVLSELPERTDLTLEVELSDNERKLYDAARLDALSKLSQPEPGASKARSRAGADALRVLAELTRLRQLCCHPRLAFPKTRGLPQMSSKHQALMELLDELQRGKHRALVFSQFVQHLALVRTLLDEARISYQYLDGSTKTKERDARIAAFQAGEGSVFLISLKAGGVGLNLTAADYVIHLDPWWNPAVEDQASDRAHRIGQTRPVTVYRLIARDTIEEKLIALHQHKRDLADQVLSAAGTSGRLSAKELLELLKQQ